MPDARAASSSVRGGPPSMPEGLPSMPEGPPSGCVLAEGDTDTLFEPHETTPKRAAGAASEPKENGRTEPP